MASVANICAQFDVVPAASRDTGVCYGPPHVNETGIYRCYKSLGRVPAAVLNCLC